MIPITRKLVKTVRSVFRAALGLSSQSQGTPLHVKTGPYGLVISAAMFGRGIRYHVGGSFPEHEFWLPFEFLKATEGNRNDAVLIDPASDGINVQWVVDSVPQTRTFHVDDPPDAITLPAVDFTDNEPELLVALSEAARTCDSGSTRYALSCIQLRGETGEVVATDSHQLLIEGGFDRLHVFGPDSPVTCIDGARQYVWMLLGKDGTIKPSPQAIRIESAATSEPATEVSATTIQTSARNPTPMKPTKQTRSTASATDTQSDNSISLIDRAEALRTSLHTALADARNLIITLKQQQKTSRSVQSALKSLRQLEALDV